MNGCWSVFFFIASLMEKGLCPSPQWNSHAHPLSATNVFQLFGLRLGGRLLAVESNLLLHERVVGFARHAVGRKNQRRQTPSHRSRAVLWRLPLSKATTCTLTPSEVQPNKVLASISSWTKPVLSIMEETRQVQDPPS